MNPPFHLTRFIRGFFLAPIGIQVLFLLHALQACLFGDRYCVEGIILGGFGMAIFIFPTTWFFELCFGLPVIGILWYFRWLRSWVLISCGGLAGGLLFIPNALKMYARFGLEMRTFSPLISGVCFGALTAAVMWFFAFREAKPIRRDNKATE